MDDLTAVLDAAGFECTTLFGASDLGLCALFAATYPERVRALVLSAVAADGLRTTTPADDASSRSADVVDHSAGGHGLRLALELGPCGRPAGPAEQRPGPTGLPHDRRVVSRSLVRA